MKTKSFAGLGWCLFTPLLSACQPAPVASTAPAVSPLPCAAGGAPAANTVATATAAAPKPVPYPAEAKGPPPVGLPEGQGLAVKLQKYIVVDQFGYRPSLAKVAVLVDPELGWNAADSYTPGPELEVRKWSDGSRVFAGPIQTWNGGKLDESAGDRGAWFDFSKLLEPGLYYVFDPKNSVRSHPFEIENGVYKRVLKTATRMFYFNRANFAKKPPFSCVGKRCWSLGADYLGEGQDKSARSVSDRSNAKTARDLSGGWWDAGDTDKYVTFSNDALHQLMTAYEEHPSAFGDDFGIPESGNGVPDLIDEILVELDWLKKMQPADLKGGALIKMGNVDYGDPVPDQSKFPRFYYPAPCSSATITVAGEFAHGALLFAKFPRFRAYAKDLGERARRAFDFYVANPKSDACDDGTIKSGDADRSLSEQEQLAVSAAAYLFALGGEAKYSEWVAKNYGKTRPFQDDRWSVYDQSQGDALLFYSKLPKADATARAAIVERKKSQAASLDLYGFRPELDLYRAYMRPDSYHWGSNNARASYGNTNYDVLTYELVDQAQRASFVERAAGILHSFHGVNPMQLVYLTNMYADGAEQSADETYHTWFRDKDPRWDNARTSELGPAPGYVTGGPNKSYCQGQDPKEHACARSAVRDQPPEKAYLDVNTSYEPQNPYDKSWELTEPAIYYQASYVRLLSKFVD
ncbi:MAG TPA: glycoside hydrolase family 9 protein [Polyangiaceae bacterium]|nr:glycoside hydrolase family 9 protein [Polyangiaceae bacterium]